MLNLSQISIFSLENLKKITNLEGRMVTGSIGHRYSRSSNLILPDPIFIGSGILK